MSQVNQFVQQFMQPLKRFGSGRNPRAYTQGLTPYRQKQWQQAVECFTQAATEQPDHAPSHFKLGMSHFRLKEYEAALTAMTRALELDPSQKQWQEQLDQVARHVAAKAKQSPGEKEQTIRDQIERLDNPSAMLYNQLAHTLRNQGKWEQEIEALKIAIVKDASHPTWFFRLGEALEVLRLFRSAATYYEKAINLKGEATPAAWYYRLGYSYESEGDDGPAEPIKSQYAYQSAIFFDKELNAQRFGIGIFHQRRGLWPQAIKAYEAQLKKYIWDAELNYRLGMMCGCCNEWSKAEQFYKNALTVDIQKPHYHFSLGFALEKLGKFNEAESAYQYAALNREPHTPYWFHRWGLVLNRQGNYEESAFVHLQTHQEKNENIIIDPYHNCSAIPHDASLACDNYIQNILSSDYINIALDHLYKMNAEDSESWYQEGLIYERKKQWDVAAKSYLKAIKAKHDNDTELNYRLGFVQASSEDFFNASNTLEKVNVKEGFDRRIEREVKIKVVNFYFSEGRYFFSIEVKNLSNINKDIKIDKVVLKHRERIGNEVDEFLVETKVDYSSPDMGKVIASFNFDEKELNLEMHYWDLFIELKVLDKIYGHANVRIPLRHFSESVLQEIKDNPWEYSTIYSGKIFHPYITVGGQKVAFLKRPKSIYDENVYFEREKQAIDEYTREKEKLDNKKAWLIFEKFSQTAQDNGFYFFKHAVKKRPHVYYVIDKDSPDCKYLAEYQENVVEFMSVEHMKLLLSCEKIISSEGRGHGYAWRRIGGIFKSSLLEKEYVFLQHGVIGLKKLGNDFSKNNKNFLADYFICSTLLERKIIISQFGFSHNQIILSGLPRWAELVNISSDRQDIFMMPSWRNWLEDLPEDKFIETEYFKKYSSLLTSEKLKNLLDKYKVTLHFSLHPKILKHIESFKSNNANVKIANLNDYSIRDFIQTSSILITDYSSVAWDFVYLKKPVVFYHFDRKEYDKYQGAYLNLDKDLPGVLVQTEEELLQSIEEIILAQVLRGKNTYCNYHFENIPKNPSEKIYEIITS